MRGHNNHFRVVWVLAFVLLGLGGCASRTVPTLEDYEKISLGMTYDEVIAVMGEPQKKRTALTMTNCEWRIGDKTAVVSFQEKIVADHQLK